MGPTRHQGTPTPLGAPCCLAVSSFAVWSPPEASRVSYVQKKIVKKFRSVWTPLGTDFLENQKQEKKQQLALVTGLIG
jgi:hypothetical protein